MVYKQLQFFPSSNIACVELTTNNTNKIGAIPQKVLRRVAKRIAMPLHPTTYSLGRYFSVKSRCEHEDVLSKEVLSLANNWFKNGFWYFKPLLKQLIKKATPANVKDNEIALVAMPGALTHHKGMQVLCNRLIAGSEYIDGSNLLSRAQSVSLKKDVEVTKDVHLKTIKFDEELAQTISARAKVIILLDDIQSQGVSLAAGYEILSTSVLKDALVIHMPILRTETAKGKAIYLGVSDQKSYEESIVSKNHRRAKISAITLEIFKFLSQPSKSQTSSSQVNIAANNKAADAANVLQNTNKVQQAKLEPAVSRTTNNKANKALPSGVVPIDQFLKMHPPVAGINPSPSVVESTQQTRVAPPLSLSQRKGKIDSFFKPLPFLKPVSVSSVLESPDGDDDIIQGPVFPAAAASMSSKPISLPPSPVSPSRVFVVDSLPGTSSAAVAVKPATPVHKRTFEQMIGEDDAEPMKSEDWGNLQLSGSLFSPPFRRQLNSDPHYSEHASIPKKTSLANSELDVSACAKNASILNSVVVIDVDSEQENMSSSYVQYNSPIPSIELSARAKERQSPIETAGFFTVPPYHADGVKQPGLPRAGAKKTDTKKYVQTTLHNQFKPPVLTPKKF